MQQLYGRESLIYFLALIDSRYHIIFYFYYQMNEEANMSEKKKLTHNVGAPVADNQNVMTVGPRFCAQKMVRRSSKDLSSPPLSLKSIDKSAKVN